MGDVSRALLRLIGLALLGVFVLLATESPTAPRVTADWTSSPTILRATSAAYLGLFLVAGKPFDWYWGFLAWPTWAIASGFGLAAIVRDARLAGKCLHRIKYLIALRWSAHA